MRWLLAILLHKAFKELIGKSSFEYIRSLRLTQAALRLRDNKVKIVDVALDFVLIHMKDLQELLRSSSVLPR